MIVVAELAVVRNALDVTPTVTYSWTISGDAARVEAPGRELLAFGDSLMKHGLQPLVVEPRLEMSSYNLAAPAAPAPVTYFLLRRALDAGATPRAILIDFAPDILTGGPEESRRNWPELLTTREWLELVWDNSDLEFLADSAIDRILPSRRARHELRSGTLAALGGGSTSQRDQSLDHLDHWQRSRGGHLAPKNPLFTGVVTDDEHKLLLSQGFWSHRLNELYLRKFIDLTGQREIPVYWVLPPVSPALQARRTATGADQRYTQFVRSLAVEHPHVTVLDARLSSYPHDHFVDPRHLDRDGAITLSTDIALVLERQWSGVPCPPWVHLPLFRPVPAEAALEDIVQRIQARRH